MLRSTSTTDGGTRRTALRRRARLLLGTGALVAAVAAPLPAAAAAPAGPLAPTAEAVQPVTHPDADGLGSSVVEHEPAPLPVRPATGLLGADAGPQAAALAGSTRGIDVSGYQAAIRWPVVSRGGARFAYVKATEGTGYVNTHLGGQYVGSYAAGLVRGAYHFALPDRSSGAAQADWFVRHGGGWSADGRTLPPLLDIEYNPYGPSCYGLGQPAMVGWLRAFSTRVRARTGRSTAIYTTANWWSTCTGGDTSFGADHPLFVARYAATPGRLPAGWSTYTFWQYADHGAIPGDQDLFRGSLAQLTRLARG